MQLSHHACTPWLVPVACLCPPAARGCMQVSCHGCLPMRACAACSHPPPGTPRLAPSACPSASGISGYHRPLHTIRFKCFEGFHHPFITCAWLLAPSSKCRQATTLRTILHTTTLHTTTQVAQSSHHPPHHPPSAGKPPGRVQHHGRLGSGGIRREPQVCAERVVPLLHPLCCTWRCRDSRPLL